MQLSHPHLQLPWQRIPILECREPLVLVEHDRVLTDSMYPRLGYSQGMEEIYVRRGVAEALKRAAQLLPPGLQLLLWDGWRPAGSQNELFHAYQADIHERTGLIDEALERETLKFVNRASVDRTRPAPHITGGSIDLTLADADGEALDMGGDFDELSQRSFTAYYEHHSGSEHVAYCDRRRLLCAVMTHVGFSNYAEEWWHFDMGNQFHHYRVGGPARYGLAYPN